MYILVIKKKKKTIKEYAELLTKIRDEYAKLQKENNQLKIELQKYQTYVQNRPQRLLQWAWTKWTSDSYVTEIRRRPKKQRKRILYYNEIDDFPEYEPDSPTDEEQEEDNNYEIQNKRKEKQPKQNQ